MKRFFSINFTMESIDVSLIWYKVFHLLGILVLLLTSMAFAQNESTWHKGVIVVKFSDEAVKSLSLESIDGIALSGIQSVDALNQIHLAWKMERAFHPAGKFEERHRQFGLHRWYMIYFSEDADVERLVGLYSNDVNIEVSELHYEPVLATDSNQRAMTKNNDSIFNIFQNPIFPNDPLFSNQWHYHSASDIDIDLPEAWDIETGDTNVIVSIMDTGTDLDHPDLLANLWVNRGEIPGNGIDDDNNGYIDDIHGWNFDQNNNNPDDYDDHGTHTAGTIAAVTNNNLGVAGVAGGFGNGDGARIMVCRILGPGGGGNHNAYTYAADNGSVISSNSWAYWDSNNNPVPLPFLVRQAIDYFVVNAGSSLNSPIQGGIVVAAAANFDRQDPYYPAAYDSIIAVAATNAVDRKASFSNYGAWVDISAPGVSVLSTTIGSYANFQGTSMACPHVAGVLALIASEFPGITNDNARTLVEFAVDNIDAQNPAYLSLLGSGRLNAFYAVQAAATVQGLITDSSQGFPINNVTITDINSGNSFITDNTGNYDLKIFGEGIHVFELSVFGFQTRYDSLTLNAPVQPGTIQTINQDFQLMPNPMSTLSGSLTDSLSGNAVEGRIIVYAISSKSGTPVEAVKDTVTDINGSFNISLSSMEDYQVIAYPQSPYPSKKRTILDFPVGGVQLDLKFDPAEYMLVDDDQGEDYENYFIDALTQLSKSYHHWEIHVKGVPTSAQMAEYPGKIVLWFTGDGIDSTLNPTEQAEILAHISNGGKLLLTGQNIAEKLDGTSFMNNLGLGFASNIPLVLVTGVPGDIGDGLAFTTIGSGGANNQTSKDELAIVDSTQSRSIFLYGTSATSTAGAAIEINSSKLIFLGFGMEAISSLALRESVLDVILNYLDQPTSIDWKDLSIIIPEDYELFQNFPNPFNPQTTIRFAVPESSEIQINVYNSLGQKVRQLARENYSPGYYEVIWDGQDDYGSSVASGVYFYKMISETGRSQTRKLLLLK